MAEHERRRAAFAQGCPQRVRDGPMEVGEVGPGGCGLERLDHHAAVEQLAAQIGCAETLVLPGGPGSRAESQSTRGPQQHPRAVRPIESFVRFPFEAQYRQATVFVSAQLEVALGELRRASTRLARAR